MGVLVLLAASVTIVTCILVIIYMKHGSSNHFNTSPGPGIAPNPDMKDYDHEKSKPTVAQVETMQNGTLDIVGGGWNRDARPKKEPVSVAGTVYV